MWRRLAALAILGACSFQHGASALGGDGNAGGGDAARDAGRMDALGDSAHLADASHDAPAMPLACPSGYTLTAPLVTLSLYRSVTASTDWASAEADCENDAAPGQPSTHLIVLDDVAERSWAYSTTTSDQWAGESDRIVEGVYLPVTDQLVFYANPNGNNPGLDCVIIKQLDTSAENCNTGHPYLCECDGLAADASHF